MKKCLGLMTIGHEHERTLRHSCEKALVRRDAENANLRKAAQAVVDSELSRLLPYDGCYVEVESEELERLKAALEGVE